MRLSESEDDLVEIPVTEEDRVAPELKDESGQGHAEGFRRVYGLPDAPTAPDLQLDWLSSSDSEESDVGVEVVYMYKNRQSQNQRPDQQSDAASGKSSSLVPNTQPNPVAVVDLTQEETDEESHPSREEPHPSR